MTDLQGHLEWLISLKDARTDIEKAGVAAGAAEVATKSPRSAPIASMNDSRLRVRPPVKVDAVVDAMRTGIEEKIEGLVKP